MITSLFKFPNSKNNNTILLISQEMSYSGSPHSLLRICKVLKKYNYNVEVWSYKDGNFSQEFEKYGIEVKVVPPISYKTKETKQKIKTFNLAICNTVLTETAYNIVRTLVPTIWYIREAKNLETFENPLRLKLLKESNNLYCVSEYAKKYIKLYYNNKSKVVHNCVEDHPNKPIKQNNERTIKLLSLGTIEPRKGFGVVVNAIKSLPEKYKSNISYDFGGRTINKESFLAYYTELMHSIKNENNINYLGEICDINKKFQLYADTDIVIVPSTDESCSLVVLEAIMMGKPVIVTENVGAKYVVDKNIGWIFHTNDEMQLAKIIMGIIDNNPDLNKMGEAARIKYLATSNMDIYEKNILKMVKDNIGKKRKIMKPKKNFKQICQNFFSIRNSKDKTHKNITILGIKIKLKRRSNAQS